jgi:hypothetical protein
VASDPARWPARPGERPGPVASGPGPESGPVESGPTTGRPAVPRGRRSSPAAVRAGQTSGYQPLVGVPEPTAMAKMCMALIPFPTPLLTVGSVTEATVFPASSGTEAK